MNEPTLAVVRLTAEWVLPEDLAQKWVEVHNARWTNSPWSKDSAKAIINAAVATPGGQPELTMEVVCPKD